MARRVHVPEGVVENYRVMYDWRTDAAAWWTSPEWHAYECAYGDESGTRSRLLAGATWNTRIVDLALDEAEVWSGVRKSYRSLIHAAERALTVEALAALGAGGLIRTCQRVHRFACGGRQTRPDATWDLMGDWAGDGRGLIAMAFDYQNRPPEMTDDASGFDGVGLWPPVVDFAYFVVNGSWAYYASAASLRPGVHHAVVWRALLALKARGVRWAELGWQGEARDAKGRSVEWFKTGFGGRDEPTALGVAEVA